MLNFIYKFGREHNGFFIGDASKNSICVFVKATATTFFENLFDGACCHSVSVKSLFFDFVIDEENDIVRDRHGLGSLETGEPIR